LSTLTISDVLAASYAQIEPPPPATAANTALLLVDVQQLATPEHLAERAIASGLPATDVVAALEDYSERFYPAVANCARLLTSAREAGVACIHVRIETLSATGRDTGAAHRRMGWSYPPGSKQSQFLAPVAPLPGEIVIAKTVSGAFTATNLDSVLRHMQVDWLVIAGFETDECIEATGRTALDLGYLALFAEDACTAYETESHNQFMAKYRSWGLVRSVEQIEMMFRKLSRQSL